MAEEVAAGQWEQAVEWQWKEAAMTKVKPVKDMQALIQRNVHERGPLQTLTSESQAPKDCYFQW